MILETLFTVALPALLPAIMDGVKTVLAKVTGASVAEPKTVEDLIKLKTADIAHIKALAELDKPYGDIAPWVANFRSSIRYFAVSGILLFYLFAVVFVPEAISPERMTFLETLAGQALFFLIGDRAYLHIKQK